MAEFKTLEQIFNMVSPADLSKKVKLSLGTPEANPSENVFRRILSELLESSAKGLSSSERIKKQVSVLATNADGIASAKLGEFFKLYSTAGFFDFALPSDKLYVGPTGVEMKSIAGVTEIIGSRLKIPENKSFAALLINAPFISPATRNTGMIDIFLNSMPSIAANKLTPFLQVEFEVPRESSPHVQSFGQLKFLLGAPEISSLGTADAATFQGSLINRQEEQKEFHVAGMEMFTSPQTMINPTPNETIGASGRYAPVLDPFRPFATLESAEVTIVPAVGTFCYKKAKLTIKLHDKTRLAEISDFIRPRVYSGINIWLKYGWHMPEDFDDPYAEYINRNMQCREAYRIVNSNFTFDKVGQVQIVIDLWTTGISELRQAKISDGLGDARTLANSLRAISERILELRKRLRLDPPEGLNKEIRVYQLLDAAQSGESPNLKREDVAKLITQLQDGMNKRPIDKVAANQLIAELKKFYSIDNAAEKHDYKQRFENTVASSIKARFDEVATGPDPFLPDAAKGHDAALLAEIAKYKAEPAGETKTFNKNVVSFGKVFGAFVVPSILHSDSGVDELQIFTYQLNEQAGLMSLRNIAEFPIDMKAFADQYKSTALSRGGEMMTIEQFLGLLISAQFLDDNAIGYGLRAPQIDPSKKATEKDAQGNYESALAQRIGSFGGWKKPAIEMYIEVTHQRVDDDAAPVIPGDTEKQKLRKIMRIHVYDKQLNPYSQPAALLRSADGNGFIERPSTAYAQSQQSGKISDLEIKALEQITEEAATGKISIASITSNRQIKDLVSKMMPTISIGANGSMITEASLSSKNDPLLNTVNMTRSMTVKNTAAPNGAGSNGLPLRVIPATLSMTSLGCPLATMAQYYFIDFNTGTTLDNLYVVTGLTHAMSPGKFETSWQFGYADGYGRYEGAPNIIDQIAALKDIKE